MVYGSNGGMAGSSIEDSTGYYKWFMLGSSPTPEVHIKKYSFAEQLLWDTIITTGYPDAWSYFSSPIAVDGNHIYTLGPNETLVILDKKNGSRVYTSSSGYRVSVAAAKREFTLPN